MGIYDDIRIPLPWGDDDSPPGPYCAGCRERDWSSVALQTKSFPDPSQRSLQLGDAVGAEDADLDFCVSADTIRCDRCRERPWQYWFHVIVEQGTWTAVEQYESCRACRGWGGDCCSGTLRCDGSGHASSIAWRTEIPPPLDFLDELPESVQVDMIVDACLANPASPALFRWIGARKAAGLAEGFRARREAASGEARRKCELALLSLGSAEQVSSARAILRQRHPIEHEDGSDVRCAPCERHLKTTAHALLRADPTPESWRAAAAALLEQRWAGVRSYFLDLLVDMRHVVTLEEAVGFLAEVCRRHGAALAVRAARLLRKLNDPRCGAALHELLEHRDQHVQAQAARGVAQLGLVQAVPRLLPLLRSPNSYVATTAEAALRDLVPRGALEALEGIARSADPESSEARRMLDLLRRGEPGPR